MASEAAPLCGVVVRSAATWRRHPHVYLAHLVYTAKAAARDTTVLRVDAQLVWVRLRPVSERLSSSGHVTLTGYRQLSFAPAPQDPVSKPLGRVALAHLGMLANSLSEAPSHLGCMQDTTAYRCERTTEPSSSSVTSAAPRLSVNGRLLAPLSDRHCVLLKAVQQLLPGTARASRHAGAGRASR